MINGEVTPDREAVISIRVRNAAGQEVAVQAVIDTGFTEFLSLPPNVIESLLLPLEYDVPMLLTGDIPARFDAHSGWIEWDGEWREVEVIKADGPPIVGMALLRGFRLTVDGLDGGQVAITRLPL